MTELMRDLIEKAIAGGITRAQIDLLLETYPAMRKESWWREEAMREPVRAVKYRLESLEVQAFKQRAARWTGPELRAVAAEHRRGRPVDTDMLAEAVARGFISESSAMNSDF